MRLVSWNCSRLRDGLPELGDPDVLCLQEIRVRPGDGEAIARMQGALPGYACGFALADDARNVRSGHYGVATYVRESLRPTFVAPAWDREGRVVVAAIAGLAIVNLYAVNGTAKPYFDEHGVVAGDRHAHKRRFQERIFALAAELRSAASVILAGDWNVSRTALDTHPRLRVSAPHVRARAELNAWLDRGDFVDVFRALHPDARQYTWFNRLRPHSLDAARVDFIVTSADLVPRVRSATILDDAARRPGSDHAPIAVDVDPVSALHSPLA